MSNQLFVFFCIQNKDRTLERAKIDLIKLIEFVES